MQYDCYSFNTLCARPLLFAYISIIETLRAELWFDAWGDEGRDAGGRVWDRRNKCTSFARSLACISLISLEHFSPPIAVEGRRERERKRRSDRREKTS